MNTYGWAGNILWVNLSEGTTKKISTSEFEPEKYIGGIGLNSRLFWEMGCPKVDALHSDNPILLSVGPLTGVSGPVGRATASAIAPQCFPEELFTYSGFGGRFPTELKYAGYDSVVITGKAEKPVYLSRISFSFWISSEISASVSTAPITLPFSSRSNVALFTTLTLYLSFLEIRHFLFRTSPARILRRLSQCMVEIHN